MWIDGAWELSTDPRNDDGAPDGYDSMGPEKCSKNILTIGAIDDLPHGYQGPENVVMADFSNWGPTDDGRIKPDLVANGIAVFSPAPVGEVEYVAMTGTSSASPSVCGSLVLVRSSFEEELGYPPAAATLKALVLHTAHEAGIADGPDYQHGWGVLNTLGAVQIIQSHAEEERRIVENLLANQQQHSYQLQIAEGASVCATMVWTDPPGPVLPAQLDPTEPMLVHDLDLRITSPEAEVFLPWILDPVQPSQAATRGDNLRDNVEKIQFVAPASGIYSLAVSHKGSILEQAYSLTLTGAYLEACTERVPSTPIVCIHKRLQYIELQWQAITETSGRLSHWRNGVLRPLPICFFRGRSCVDCNHHRHKLQRSRISSRSTVLVSPESTSRRLKLAQSRARDRWESFTSLVKAFLWILAFRCGFRIMYLYSYLLLTKGWIPPDIER